METRTERFESLDSWRGIAAVAVALFHFKAMGFLYTLPLIRNGNLSVPFFFVLSGFVITHAYYDRVSDSQGAVRFLFRRFGRIYPLHIVTLGIFVALECIKVYMASRGFQSAEAPFSGTNDISSLIANVFLLHAVIPFPDLTWNGPSWSISVEFYTYILFAAIFMLGRYRLWGTAVVLAISGTLLQIIDMRGIVISLTSGLGLLQCLFGFGTGVLTYRFFRHMKRSGFQVSTAMEAVGAAIMLVVFWFRPSYTVVTILAFAIVVFVFAFETGSVSRFLRRSVFLFLGRISYSIYLVHFIVFALGFVALRMLQSRLDVTLIQSYGTEELLEFGFPGATDLMAIGYLAIVIAGATITYTLVEKPGRDFFNKLSNRLPTSPAIVDRNVKVND